MVLLTDLQTAVDQMAEKVEEPDVNHNLTRWTGVCHCAILLGCSVLSFGKQPIQRGQYGHCDERSVTRRECPQCRTSRTSNLEPREAPPALWGGEPTAVLPVTDKGASLRNRNLNLRVLATDLFEIQLQGKPNWVKLKRDIKRRPDFSLRNQSGWYLFLLF